MKTTILKTDLFWPLALIGLACMIVLGGSVLALVGEFDVSARAREQQMVENGLTGRIEEAAGLPRPTLVSDEAVRRLDNRFDASWSRETFGALARDHGLSAVLVFDAQGRPVFTQGAAEPFIAASSGSLAQIRRAEATAVPPPGGPPIQATTLAVVNGLPQILTATRVQPGAGVARLTSNHAPIVVTAVAMDGPFLAAFARRFLIEGVRIQAAGERFEPSEAHAILRDAGGHPVALLAWTPISPGRVLLQHLLAPMLGVVAALIVVALYLFQRSRRMAEGLVASEARAAHLAFYDALTGLPNRTLYFDRLSHALEQMRRRPHRIAVHCIDLDRFKEVNDTYGHHVGDELIREAAHRMAAQCRASDTFARLSGDEFAIIQADATPGAAAALASRLVSAMNEPIQLGAGRMFSGCSIGVSMIDDGNLDPTEALRQADLALYRAKANGRLQYCFFEVEMDAAIKTRRALEADLREALARGELKLAYQPQVNRTGEMTGVEALIRWNHVTRGPVSPAFFIPIAEECGLIVELGMFTLRQAFEDARRWPHLKVAINVSANQMRMKDFVDRVEDLVRELGADPHQFELEITEGILLGDDPSTLQTLRRLRGLGFSLALDDFGTGYSSLSYLQRYPITKIKIDRAFIANLGVDEEAEAVVGAIVKLARALKLSVIAEGVETTDQRSRLASAGCSAIQGFLFSRPVPADDIDGLVAAGRALKEQLVV